MSAPRLRPGDRIRFVSPASTPDRAAVARGKALVESWGLGVELGHHTFDTVGYLAGHDQDRLADLNDALRDPGVRAIFATRGGKGAYRIAADLDDVATAMERIEAGTYWTDELTGAPIPDDVLAAFPTARRAPASTSGDR